MPKPLVIVESPAKARSIGKFLGSGYTVKASMGHVRDLPKSKLGIDVDAGFEAAWEPLERRTKVLDDLKARIAKTDILYLATDPDREGEAIAWHLVEELLGGDRSNGPKVQRVVFHEITKPAIQESFQHPIEIDTHRVDAYRTRRILDRLMGYQLSPLLWKKLARGLSAGRVQSVAVRLVVEREREIRAFEPEEYWRITARFGRGQKAFEAAFMRLDGKRTHLPDEAAAMAVMERARGGPLTVSALQQRPKTDRPRPPFITSTLQQAAAGRLGFTARRTMRVAQQLYEGVQLGGDEGGLITYMRTDSFNVSRTAQQAALEYIGQKYGAPYVPERPNAYRSKKGAQEAHEAIRPTDPTCHPDSLKGRVPPDLLKLYNLVWRKFMASQMTPARYQVTTVELERNGAAFEAQGRVVKFDGHTRVYGQDKKKDEDQGLPALEEGQQLDPTAIDPTQHFTTPPRRYSEASLVRALEKHGIGRPSTYAAVLSTIVDRGYVDHGEETQDDALRQQRSLGAEPEPVPEPPATQQGDDDDEEEGGGPPGPRRKSRSFHATHLGEVVTDMLLPHFKDIVNTEFTARMESQLDRISEGQADWHEVVAGFYEKFSCDLEAALEKMEPYWKQPILTDVICGKLPEDGGAACEAPMAILFNRFGTFLGCSRYPDCQNTRSLSGVEKTAAEMTDVTCRKRDDEGKVCGRPMERKVNRWGSAFLACTGFSEKKCNGTVSLSTAGEPLWPVETSAPCPDCGVMLMVKRSRRGKFLACPQYPKCRGTLSLPKCPHTSSRGKVCGKPMTEPGPRGRMACKTHKAERSKPPAPRANRDGKAGSTSAATAKSAGPTRKKATRKKTTRKKASSRARPAPRSTRPTR